MSFVSDKQVLKPGLVIFRRGDVQHDNWYCRVKLPKADRYKTVSLKTNDCGSAWKRDPGSGVIGVEKGPLIPVV